MSREYRHIEQYEKEIMKLREEGLSQREIGERLGFRKEQIINKNTTRWLKPLIRMVATFVKE